MQQYLTIFLDPDTIETLVEESMPWFMAWCFLLAFVLCAIVIGNGFVRLRERRSPVEKMLRRRVG